MARATRATREDARRRRGLTSSRDRWRDDRAQAEAKTGDDATATTTRGETKARGARREKSGANAGDEDVEIEYVAAPIELA